MKIESKKEKPKLIPIKDVTQADDHAGRAHDFFKNTAPDLNKMLDEVIEKKGDFFCAQPFVHMYIPTYGYQHVCCNTSMSVKKHISQADSFEELYNQPEFTRLREEIVGGHQVRERTLKTCVRCIQTEYHGFPSLRESYIRSAKKNPETKSEMEYLVDYVKQNGGTIPFPKKFHTVELKIWGNYCNLKCIMCSPEDSSSVGQELIELGESTVERIKETTYNRTGMSVPFEPPLITYADNHIKEDQYWDIIQRSVRIKLIGGETFLQKQNIQLLERCVEEGWAPEKELIIFTNNYGYPNMEYVKELLSNFKKIVYKCSLEFWGEKNDYIRYPSDWNTVYKNMVLMNDLPNLTLNPTCTLNPLTIGYVDEIILGSSMIGGAEPNFSSVGRPMWFTAHCIPEDIRDFYLERYYSLSYDVKEKCKKAIVTLEQREFNDQRYHMMINRIIARDKHRKQNILQYFPEWTPHFIHDEYYNR